MAQLTPQTGQNLIDNFGQDTGDTTELSTVASLALAEKWYRIILGDRDWEFLKKSSTGTVSVANGVATISVPTDFDHFAINAQPTDPEIAIDTYVDGNGSPKVIYLQCTSGVYTPYRIIDFSARRQYLNQAGFCYLDVKNNLITFTQAPTISDLSYEFDYIYAPDMLTLTTSPVFPARFHDAIHHGMATDDQIFQLFDRSHSYLAENANQYKSILSLMGFWNAQLQNM